MIATLTRLFVWPSLPALPDIKPADRAPCPMPLFIGDVAALRAHSTELYHQLRAGEEVSRHE